MNWLSSATWQGVAGIAAILSLAFYLYDRRKGKKSDAVRYILSCTGFFLMGASYGIPLCGIALGIGDLLTYLGVQPIGGNWGDLGVKLSRGGFAYWGFSQDISLLSRQLGAITLWVGSLSCGGLALLIGIKLDFDFAGIDRNYLFIPALSVFIIITIALKGILT